MLNSPPNRRTRNTTDFRCSLYRQVAVLDSFDTPCNRFGITNLGTTELYAPLLRRVNALSLPFFDVGSFGFCNERKKLQDKIGNKLSDQSIGFVRRIKERHVEDTDIHTFDLDEDSPLLKNVLIVPAEPIERLDDKHISGFKFPDESFPSGSVEVLSACHVDENLIVCNACFV